MLGRRRVPTRAMNPQLASGRFSSFGMAVGLSYTLFFRSVYDTAVFRVTVGRPFISINLG